MAGTEVSGFVGDNNFKVVVPNRSNRKELRVGYCIYALAS